MFVAIGATREESGEWDAPIARKKIYHHCFQILRVTFLTIKAYKIQTSL